MLENDKIEQTCTTSTKVASRILTRYVGVLCPSLRMADVSPRLSPLRDDINTQNIPSDDKYNGGVDKNLEGPF